MAPAAAEGDVLSELYAWDTTVEDDFALPPDDPRRDEDKTEDAYEQMIHTASGDASDNVLSLAAQLLVKHFFRFPHVQLNVVDVLLKLCGPARSQAVRIHTLRSLLQIVKTPPATAAASTPTSAAAVAQKNTKAWLQRIDQAVQKLLEMEKSSVILRQVTPLRHALDERLEVQQDPEHKQTKLTRSLNDNNNGKVSPPEHSRKKTRDEKEAAEATESDYHSSSERDSKKVKRDDEQNRYQDDSKSNGNIVYLGQREESNGDANNEESWKKEMQLVSSKTNGRVVENESRRRGSNNTPNTFSPRNCPPCPYLFLGSVPRHTPNDEIVEFLSPVYPDIEATSVQIKQPDYNATAYAFVSLPSADMARKAIRYVASNKFRGRVFLNANFARGPPVDALLFVERTDQGLSMEDEGAVRELDFTQCDPDVWDILCQQLEHFGPLTYADKGCVRFRSVEHAKSVIRKQHFHVKGHDIYPVYDTKEQFAIDSTRRGLNVHKQSFTLKSGRLVGGGAEYRGSKGRYKEEDDDPMEGDSSGRREIKRMMSHKYRTRSRSPSRIDRESTRDRSRSRSPQAGSRYNEQDVDDHRLPLMRSRSPVMARKPGPTGSSYGTSAANKENRRDYRGKYGKRSLSPVDIRDHDNPSRAEELRGRPREREGRWMEPRSAENARDHRRTRDETLRRGFSRGPSSSPSSSSRRSGKDDIGNQPPRSSGYRRGSAPVDDGRQSYRCDQQLLEDHGKTPTLRTLHRPRSRSHSGSPPRFGKYSKGTPGGKPRSRSRSPQNQRSSAYRSREDRSIGSRPLDSHPPFQTERPRYADDRSIAEVARDEQQERQRFFQQQQQYQHQSRQEFRDPDLSRYGAGGRGGGRGGGRSRSDRDDRSRAAPFYRGGGRGGAVYHQEPQRHSHSPLPPHQQQRESHARERRDNLTPGLRSREAAYSPPPSPLLQNPYAPSHSSSGPTNGQRGFNTEVSDRSSRESSRHEHRHHSRRDQSRDVKSHRSRRDHRENHPRSGRSATPSPVRRDHTAASGGRKSNGSSPRQSFSRRSDVDGSQVEEVSAMDKKQRSNNDDKPEAPKKEAKSGGVRLVRDELFAGMDDLTVDYEEDDD